MSNISKPNAHVGTVQIFMLFSLFFLVFLSGCVQPPQSPPIDNQTTPHEAVVCGNGIAEEKETCSSCPKDVKCKNDEKCISGECLSKTAISKEKDLTYKCSKICASNEFCNANNACEKVELKNADYCGNFICEQGEKYNGKVLVVENMGKECYFDCQAQCSSAYCNDAVEIDCGCSEYAALSNRHGCINDAQPCTDCGIQETLFPEVLKTQTEIYNCLVDYFKFKPNRIIYKVFNNPNLEKCDQPEGCTGIEGGAGGADYVMFHNLDGFRAYGEVVPTKLEYLQADVHETTHYFVYQMLHGVPSWFHEVVAIQTNERLKCSEKQAAWGDAYLPDTPSGGINMVDGTNLNADFYKRLKQDKTSLSDEEKKNHYNTAVLFIIGLEQDYDCGFYCVRDIVLKLHEYELKQCSANASNCAVMEVIENQYMTVWIDGTEEKANEKIRQVASEVAGKDVTPLFNLLQIGQYEPLPSACGPTSTCIK